MSPAQGARASGLEVGRNAFKFAQGKFPPGIAHQVPTHEREKLRREAAAFIREHCFGEGATLYETLNVARDAKRDAIKESYHLLMALIHPDRAEAAREAWPAEWAQRANRAYAVLADDAARADYDESLATPDAFRPPPPRRAPRCRARARVSFKARLARAAVVLSALLAILAGLAWLDSGDEHVAFTGAARGRDIGVGKDKPRFLGMGVLPARVTAEDIVSAAPNREKPFAPLWREAPAAPAVQARPAPRPDPVAVADPLPLDPPAPGPTVAVAQAPLAAPLPPEPGPTSAQIELVVARLIGYYEAGDSDSLMALLDPKDAELPQTARARQAYFEFFRATRERRLQVKSLEWRMASATAHALGQATLQAQYVDAPGGLERDIDVDMEIALRNGQARITRLTLFPNAP